MTTASNTRISSRLVLSVAQKGVLLIALPAIFQVVTLICFLSDPAGDRFALQEGALRHRSYVMRTLICRQMAIILDAEKNLDSSSPAGNDLLRHFQEVRDSIRELCLVDGSSVSTDAQTSNLIAYDTDVVKLLSKNFSVMESPNLTMEQKNNLWKKTQADFRRLQKQIQTCMYALIETSGTVPRPLKLSATRDIAFDFAIAGCVVNLLALLVVAALFYRAIAERLATLEANCAMISRGQFSYTPMTGGDEIARLDQNLHSLAVSLADAARRQRALFDNAHDVLCYLTEDTFCFTSVNKAAAIVFQQEPQNLQYAVVYTVIHPDDQGVARKNLQDIINARSKPPFEMCAVEGAPFVVRVSRRDGTVAHTVWTVQYIPSSKTLFCVVHDFTDQIVAQNRRKEIAQMVNHDLRSPLNAIRVIYSIWEASVPLSQDGQISLVQATANTDRMLRLINELLDIEKIEAGLMILELKPFLLRSAIDSSIEATLNLARAKSLEIHCLVPAELHVFADEHRITQVIINLLSNAIKFSPKNGMIEISARLVDGFVEVSVSDKGRGIPQSMITQIFDRFRQVQKGDASSKGGSGLGLAICKSLVELHGGTIAVESVEGSGSRFYFRLPLQKSA